MQQYINVTILCFTSKICVYFKQKHVTIFPRRESIHQTTRSLIFCLTMDTSDEQPIFVLCLVVMHIKCLQRYKYSNQWYQYITVLIFCNKMMTINGYKKGTSATKYMYVIQLLVYSCLSMPQVLLKKYIID